MEFPPRHYQVSLLLTRKEKLPNCQEIPINSVRGGGKKTLNMLFPLVDATLKNKKKSQTRLTAIDYLGSNRLTWQEKAFRKLFSLKNSRFCFTGNSQFCHTFADSYSIFTRALTQNQQTEMFRKGVNSTTETRKWASATLHSLITKTLDKLWLAILS